MNDEIYSVLKDVKNHRSASQSQTEVINKLKKTRYIEGITSQVRLTKKGIIAYNILTELNGLQMPQQKISLMNFMANEAVGRK